MKPEVYAHVLMKLLEKGEGPKDAVTHMYEALQRSGRTALMPHVARAFIRLAEKDALSHRSVLIVAHKHDEKTARKASGARDAELVLDENIIGGWRLEDTGHLTDASFKKHLLSIYNRATLT